MSHFSKKSNDVNGPDSGSANKKSPSPELLSSATHESPEKASGYCEPPPYVHKKSASVDTEAQESRSRSAPNTFYAAPQIRVTVAPPVAMTESGTLILAPPLAFSRPAPDDLTYPPFEPTFLISRAKYLDKGFPLAPPPTSTHPHPFTTHDVAEADWVGFLKSIEAAATLTDKDVANSRLPIISLIPFVSKFAASGVQAYMKSSKSAEVAKEVELWNCHFFHPRRIDVILMKGQEKLNGKAETSSQDLGDTAQTGDQGNSVVDKEAEKQESIMDIKDSVYRLFIRPL